MENNNKKKRVNDLLVIVILFLLPLGSLFFSVFKLVDNFGKEELYNYLFSFALCLSSTLVAMSCALFYVEQYPENKKLSPRKTLYIASSIIIYLCEYYALNNHSLAHTILLIICILLTIALAVFITIDYIKLNKYIQQKLDIVSSANKKSKRIRKEPPQGDTNLEDDLK